MNKKPAKKVTVQNYSTPKEFFKPAKQLKQKNQLVLVIEQQSPETKKLKQKIIQMCNNLDPPYTQQVLEYIKQILGVCMFEEQSQFHIQYQDGVRIDLSQPIFTASKVQSLYDFILRIKPPSVI